ncbi:MAG: phosphoglycolate phosphatase [Anaerolineales bacterium]
MINWQRVKALCFDVDGTLSDTDDLYVQRAARVLRLFRFALSGRDPQKVARQLVMLAETPGNALYQFADQIGADNWFSNIAARFARNTPHKPKSGFLLIPGVDGLLRSLHGRYPMAVVSARGRSSTLAFLRQYDLEKYFTAIATGRTCRYTKPYPDPVLWAAEQMGTAPEDCLMIGDTVVDIQAGRAAGAQTVGVLCGFGELSELQAAGANVILPSTANLSEFLSV